MSGPAENSNSSKSEKPEIAPAENATEKATPTACRKCLEILDQDDNFCRRCGGITVVGEALVTIGRLPAPASVAVPASPLRWSENPLVVLLALSLIGPLAIGMLWRSRSFTRGWKIGLTVAVLALTVYACWFTVKAFNATFDQLRQAGLM